MSAYNVDPAGKNGKAAELKVEIDDGRSSGGHGQITLDRFNTPTRDVLRKFDNNNDGRIDAHELQAVVSTLVAEKFRSKAFRIGLIVLGVFTVILLAAMFGLTWAVVAALKDTRVQGSVLVTNDDLRAPVMTASTDLAVVDGRLVARGSSGDKTSTVLSTASYYGRMELRPDMPMSQLLSLQSLVLAAPTGAQMSLSVQAVARVPSPVEPGKWSIKLQTASGLLVLEADGTMTVQGDVGTLLADAGFAVQTGANGRRHLLSTTRWFIVCPSQDCKTWSEGDRMSCGGADEPSCEDVASDGGFQFVDDPSPSPAATTSSPSPTSATENTGTAGYMGGCGSGRLAPNFDNCGSAANFCGGGSITTDFWNVFQANNFRCQSANCNNANVWYARGVAVQVLSNGVTTTRSILSCGSDTGKVFDFCCPS